MVESVYAEGPGTALPRKGLSGSTVKLVGIVTMFIDHIGAALLGRMLVARGIGGLLYVSDAAAVQEWLAENGTLYDTYTAMRLVGRIGFPIFCFLLVEGFGKTGSRARYAVRLGLFALLSEIPFDLAFYAKRSEFSHQNVFFTLLLGLLALCVYRFLEEHRLPGAVRWMLCAAGVLLSGGYVLRQISENSREIGMTAEGLLLSFAAAAAVLGVYAAKNGLARMQMLGADLAVLTIFMVLADALRTDYSGMGVLTISVIYALRRFPVRAMGGGCAVLTLMTANEITGFFAMIPIAMYNGERGAKLKYFFYAFYPAHLLLLWLLSWLMGMGDVAAL